MGKTYRSQPKSTKGPDFTVGGTLYSISDDGELVDTGKEWSETFRCLPEAPGGALDDIAAAVSVNERGEIAFSRVSVLRFIRDVLVPADEQRFEQMVRDKHKLLDLDLLGAIMMDLSQELTGQRPTGPQRTSPGSSAGTESGSTPSSSSPAASEDGSPSWTLPPSFT